VKSKVPAWVGVPDNKPALESVIPGGNPEVATPLTGVPELDQVKGATKDPPEAEN
jgi:hypothetical protein